MEFSGVHYVNAESEMKKSRYIEFQIVKILKEDEGDRGGHRAYLLVAWQGFHQNQLISEVSLIKPA